MTLTHSLSQSCTHRHIIVVVILHTQTHIWHLHTHIYGKWETDTDTCTHTSTQTRTHTHTQSNYPNLQPSYMLLLASTNQPLPTNPHTHKITLHLTCDPSSVLWGWRWQWCHSPARRNRYGSVSESRSHAAHLQQSNNRQPEWSWPPWKSWPGPILSCCRQKTNMHKVWMAGIAQWLERRTPDWKVAGLNPCWSGGRIFLSRVNFLCCLLFSWSVL